MMNLRQSKGLAIAATSPITREGNVWLVPSQSTSQRYTVDLFLNTCTCRDFLENAGKCKHLYAAEAQLQRESGFQPEAPQKQRITYRQEWHEYNLAQTNEKARFLELLYELCAGVQEPVQPFGRPRLPLSDMLFCAAFKVYSCFSSRRFVSDIREAQARGYVSRVPHFNSVSNYLDDKTLTPYLKQLIIESSLPLKTVDWDFAVDSSGFSTGRCDRWVDTKWDKTKRAYGEETKTVNTMDWLKLHIMCGVKTNVVTAVEITGAHAGDSPQFRPLVETTSQGFPIQSVCADKAYSAEKNLKLVLVKGGQPYIDFKSNATAGNRRSGSVWKRLFLEYQYNQEWFMSHYHKRSNVETTFSMIKGKFGERLRSKTETAQINEVLCKVLCHNLCCLISSIYELGVMPEFWSEP